MPGSAAQAADSGGAKAPAGVAAPSNAGPAAYGNLAGGGSQSPAAWGTPAGQAYLLGPGDALAISVWGYPELNWTVTVRPDGLISLPLVGDVAAAGKSVGQLQSALTVAFSKHFPKPEVSVMVVGFRTLHVQALGAVVRPGIYELPPAATLKDLVAAAGGAAPDADLARATLTQGTGLAPGTAQRRLVDLRALLEGAPGQNGSESQPVPTGGAGPGGQGGNSANPILQDGDTLYIPRLVPALALGQVQAPGAYLPSPDDRILDLLAKSGGLAPDADPAHAAFTHLGRTVAVDLAKLQENPQSAENLPVAPGDKLFVPKAALVLVLGQVNRAGSYQLPPGATVADALAAAGGLSASADPTRVVLTRAADGQARTLNLAWPGGSAGRAPDLDVPVQGGDRLWVPQIQPVVVLGQVARAGSYPLPPGATVADALAAAGGMTAAADPTQVALTPASGGSPQILDLSAPASVGSTAINRPVHPGDRLFVPEGRRVTVLGAVQSPGVFYLRAGDGIPELLAMAGGPKTGEADLRAAEIRRTGQPAQPVDLQAVLSHLGQAAGPDLVSGDVLYVPPSRNRVLALGSVNRPGSFPLQEGDRLLDLVAAAGGLKDTADLAAAKLQRTGPGQQVQTLPVRLDQVMANPDSSLNLPLQPGDTLVVPEARMQVAVMGQVRAPGSYPYRPGDRLLDVLARAGGTTDKAALDQIRIYQGGNVQGARTADLGQGDLRFSGKVTENPELAPGDVVVVPEKWQIDWAQVVTYLTVIKLARDLILGR